MHINKNKFLWLVVGFSAIAVFLIAAGIFAFIGLGQNTLGSIILVSFILFGITLMILAIVYYCIFMYKMWSAINDGITRPKPGAAVGFLFIPYFNFGWIFVAISKFPYEYNRYIQRHNVPVKPMKKAVHIALPIVDLALVVVAMVLGFVVAFQVMFYAMRQFAAYGGYEHMEYHRGSYNWNYRWDYLPDWQNILITLIIFGGIYLALIISRYVLTYLFISRGADAVNALPELAKPPQPTVTAAGPVPQG